jgi:hypothetical protein
MQLVALMGRCKGRFFLRQTHSQPINLLAKHQQERQQTECQLNAKNVDQKKHKNKNK